MTDDNSVNIGNGYHHGDLRAAAIEAGLRLLSEGAAALSLRAVARSVGVSATALYRHFPDKDALLAALAADGLSRLATAQRQDFARAGGGGAGLAATGRAYVRFALANPALFRLIFANGRLPEGGGGDIGAALHAHVATSLPDGTPDQAVQDEALRAWGLVHGLAMLMLDGLLPADPALIDRLLAGRGGNPAG